MLERPNPASYRPKYSQVLKQQARPASLLKPSIGEDSPGRLRKQALFEKWQLDLGMRLANKMDRGHELRNERSRKEREFRTLKKDRSVLVGLRRYGSVSNATSGVKQTPLRYREVSNDQKDGPAE